MTPASVDDALGMPGAPGGLPGGRPPSDDDIRESYRIPAVAGGGGPRVRPGLSNQLSNQRVNQRGTSWLY